MSKDIPTLIKLGLWPSGGMRQLVEAVEKELGWIQLIDESTVVDKHFYNRFAKVLSASVYLSPQGRVQAVEDTRNNQVQELQERKFILSKIFKTQAKYGYQPVTAGEIFLQIFSKYTQFMRPKILMKDFDFVFIELDGSQLDLGRKLTVFFEGAIGLHLTSTTIRSLVETEVADLRLDNKITDIQRNSIMSLNGHSSQVTQDYYVRQDRERDVGHAFNVFDIMNVSSSAAAAVNDSPSIAANMSPPSIAARHGHRHVRRHVHVVSDDSDSDSVSPSSKDKAYPKSLSSQQLFLSPMSHASLATSSQASSKKRHLSEYSESDTIAIEPVSTKQIKRSRWSIQEINYVGEWCARTLRENPENTNNIVARCLSHIRSDPTVMSLFSVGHLLNSSRLRHGYDKYRDDNSKDD
jgi:hypothetical protein